MYQDEGIKTKKLYKSPSERYHNFDEIMMIGGLHYD